MLKDRWLDLCALIGLEGADQWHTMETEYSALDRSYHNLDHIADCLARLDEAADCAANRLHVELAIWFHDLIYDTRSSENEELSAEAAKHFLADLSMAEPVAELILSTKHERVPTTQDAMLMGDIDLSILGGPPVEYRTYAEKIRREYAWVPPDEYAVGRAQVLQMFLERPSIYNLPRFRKNYEDQARCNLEIELTSLNPAATETS